MGGGGVQHGGGVGDAGPDSPSPSAMEAHRVFQVCPRLPQPVLLAVHRLRQQRLSDSAVCVESASAGSRRVCCAIRLVDHIGSSVAIYDVEDHCDDSVRHPEGEIFQDDNHSRT